MLKKNVILEDLFRYMSDVELVPLLTDELPPVIMIYSVLGPHTDAPVQAVGADVHAVGDKAQEDAVYWMQQ